MGIVILALWAGCIAISLGALKAYSLAPGANAEAPRHWPASSSIALAPDVPTLLVLAHPKCSCTRATLYELAEMLTSLEGRIQVEILFLRPDGVESAWERTNLLESAMRLPSTRVHIDAGGAETARFGGKTSGDVLLYGPTGELHFEGGITPSRAHTGDNVGRRRIEEIVAGRTPDRREASVYGCALEDAEAGSFLLATLRGLK